MSSEASGVETGGVKKRLLGLINKIYVTTGGVHEADTPERHADDLYKLISTLRASNQLYSWPGSAVDADQTYRPGDEIRLVFIRDDGSFELAPEPLPLPERPVSLVEALEAYVQGAPWEEVKRIAATDPEIKDKEILGEFMTRIRAAKSWREFGAIFQTIGPSLKPKQRQEIVLLLERAIDLFVSDEAGECSTLEELRKLHDDAKAFYNSSNDSLTTMNAFDTLDLAALHIVRRTLERATSVPGIQKVANSASSYPFAFTDLYRPLVASALEDTRARLRFIQEIRRVNAASAGELRRRIEEFPFMDDELREPYRNELLEKLDKKVPQS